ncbi:hypothetical protein ACFL27_27630 [candidate division CSSED10-310 bacterium]|uniref:Uncharacterized protein n=1 Tax=candidate division CSSED10-310 bacterium TaxID=2855610 RepID=A0ABV6Z6A1_UNCC1
MRLKKLFILVVFSVLGLACLFSCMADSESDDALTAQIICQIGLTKSMIESYSITQVRVTIKQGETVIWGPTVYDVAQGSATITGVEPGSGYKILVEALISDGTVNCSGESGSFEARADQTTDVGYIHLKCVGLACSFSPATVNPVYDNQNSRWVWYFDYIIRETKGTGVRLDSLIMDFYSLADVYQRTEDRSYRIVDYFDTDWLPAFAELICTDWWWYNSNGVGWKMKWTYGGTDANGNRVECSCWVTLNSAS